MLHINLNPTGTQPHALAEQTREYKLTREHTTRTTHTNSCKEGVRACAGVSEEDRVKMVLFPFIWIRTLGILAQGEKIRRHHRRCLRAACSQDQKGENDMSLP